MKTKSKKWKSWEEETFECWMSESESLVETRQNIALLDVVYESNLFEPIQCEYQASLLKIKNTDWVFHFGVKKFCRQDYFQQQEKSNDLDYWFEDADSVCQSCHRPLGDLQTIFSVEDFLNDKTLPKAVQEKIALNINLFQTHKCSEDD